MKLYTVHTTAPCEINILSCKENKRFHWANSLSLCPSPPPGDKACPPLLSAGSQTPGLSAKPSLTEARPGFWSMKDRKGLPAGYRLQAKTRGAWVARSQGKQAWFLSLNNETVVVSCSVSATVARLIFVKICSPLIGFCTEWLVSTSSTELLLNFYCEKVTFVRFWWNLLCACS